MQSNPVDLIADELLAGADAIPIEALPEVDARIEKQVAALKEFLSKVDARTEKEIGALKAFLSKWSQSPHTLRRYRIEIARLWLWATEQGCLISELSYEDLNAYRNFLQDPRPYERWCSGKKYRRDSQHWRPFVSALSLSSIHHAFSAIGAMYSVWLRSGHITCDPMANVTKIKEVLANGVTPFADTTVDSTEKWFDDRMASAIREALASMPEETPAAEQQRAQYTLIVRTLTVTGARVSELVHAKQSQIYEDRSGWWIKLRGKGGKLRTVPLPNDYITDVLMPWRIEHDLPAIPEVDEITPLCPTRAWKQGKPGISSRMVLNIVKDIAARAAALLPADAQRASRLLPRASNHWFRHTFITALIDQNVPTKTILTTVGQKSEHTLRIYDHKQDHDRHVDVTRVASKL